MSDLTVRPYQPSDDVIIRDLSKRLTVGFAPWRDQNKVRETIEGWIDASLDNAASPNHSLLVAVKHGSVVGFVALEAQDHYIAGRDASIGELVVAEDAEGQGVGQVLVTAATAWAQAQGCERLTLQTGAANHRARTFYERLGFEYEDVSMAKPLLAEP